MTPEGAIADRHIDRHSFGPRDPDGEPCLFDTYVIERARP